MMLSAISVFYAPNDREGMIRSLCSALGPTSVKNGCMSYRLFLDIQDEQSLPLISRWRSREDLDTYLHTDLFRKVLSVVDLSCKEPTIEFDELQATSGIEFLGTEE